MVPISIVDPNSPLNLVAFSAPRQACSCNKKWTCRNWVALVRAPVTFDPEALVAGKSTTLSLTSSALVVCPRTAHQWRRDATSTQARASAPCMRASSRYVDLPCLWEQCETREVMQNANGNVGARAYGGRWRHRLRAAQKPRPDRFRRNPYSRPRHHRFEQSQSPISFPH